MVDEGNLYNKTKRDNIPSIVYQICNISREVVNALPYDFINLLFIKFARDVDKRHPLRVNFYLIKIYGMMG